MKAHLSEAIARDPQHWVLLHNVRAAERGDVTGLLA
jgi:hypothetical protein